jgi:hypothetical protein
LQRKSGALIKTATDAFPPRIGGARAEEPVGEFPDGSSRGTYRFHGKARDLR